MSYVHITDCTDGDLFAILNYITVKDEETVNIEETTCIYKMLP